MSSTRLGSSIVFGKSNRTIFEKSNASPCVDFEKVLLLHFKINRSTSITFQNVVVVLIQNQHKDSCYFFQNQ